MTLFGRFREEFFKSSDEICSETISSSSNSDETSIASISFSIDVLISSVDWPVTEVSVVVVRSCNLFVEDLLVPEIDSELEDLGQDFEENFEDMEEDFDGVGDDLEVSLEDFGDRTERMIGIGVSTEPGFPAISF